MITIALRVKSIKNYGIVMVLTIINSIMIKKRIISFIYSKLLL